MLPAVDLEAQLYKLARKGLEVDREPRSVTIYSIELTDFDGTELEVEIACSKGTYIRTIADDLGQALGCGAHIFALHRTQAGAFTEEDCVSTEFLMEEKAAHGLEGIDSHLRLIESYKKLHVARGRS